MQKLIAGSPKLGKEHCCVLCSKLYKRTAKGSSRYCINCLRHRHSWASKVWAVEYKGGKCTVCNYNQCLSALEFHHVDPSDKDMDLSSKTLSFRSVEVVEKELRKCVLLCSNCHRELHAALEAVTRNEPAESIIEIVTNTHLLWTITAVPLGSRLKWYDYHPKTKENKAPPI